MFLTRYSRWIHDDVNIYSDMKALYKTTSSAITEKTSFFQNNLLDLYSIQVRLYFEGQFSPQNIKNKNGKQTITDVCRLPGPGWSFLLIHCNWAQFFASFPWYKMFLYTVSCPLFTQPFSYFRNGLYKLSWNGSFNYLWLERWQLFGLENRIKCTCIIMMIFSSTSTVIYFKAALIKKKTKFSSYIRKFRWDRVQSHIWGRTS